MPKHSRFVEQRRLFREAGKCTSCGGKRSNGFLLCPECRVEQRKKAQKNTEKRKERGQCLACRVKVEDGKLKCAVCREKLAENHRNRKKRRREEGLCLTCGITKTNSESYCRKCLDRANAWAKRRSEQWRSEGLCLECGRERMLGLMHCVKCVERKRTSNRALKDRVFEKYGGYVCACCGEKERLFLQIDHINNDGNKHRKKIGHHNFYLWLEQNNYPEGYQILCANCNWGKMLNKGICPHKGGDYCGQTIGQLVNSR